LTEDNGRLDLMCCFSDVFDFTGVNRRVHLRLTFSDPYMGPELAIEPETE